MYRYSQNEKKYIGKARNNVEFKKFEERCRWATEKSSQDEINGAILLTRLCGLDFTSNHYYQKVKNKKEYIKISKRPNFMLFLEPFMSHSLKPFEHSKIVIFDIDQRNNSYQLKTIITQLRLLLGDPFYIEYGIKRKNRKYDRSYIFEKKPEGAHLYYQFDEYITDGGLKEIENILKRKGYIVEPIYKNNTIRLPMTYDSAKYRYFGYEVTNHKPIITDKRKTKMELRDLQESYFELYRCFRKKDSKTNPVPDWLQEICDNDIEKAKKYRIFNSTNISDIGDIYDKDKIYDLSTGLNFLHIDSDYNPNRVYGNGTRYRNQIAIGFDTLRINGDYSQFVSLCELYNDGTSKDMKLPSIKKEKILKGIWNYCKLKFSHHSSYQFTFNKDYYYHDEDFDLSDSEYTKLNKMVNYYYLKDAWGKPFGKDQENFVQNVIKLYTQVKQKALHDKVTDGRYTKNPFLKPMEEGIALSQVLVKKICKYYNIKNRHRVLKFLKKYKFIEPIGIEIDGQIRYYSYKNIRYCKHYIVHTVQDRYNKVKRNFNINKLEHFILQLQENGVIKKNFPFKYFYVLSSLIKTIYNNTKNILINNILYKYLYSQKPISPIPINNVFKINISSLENNIGKIVKPPFQLCHSPP